jgi:UPF0755 protein
MKEGRTSETPEHRTDARRLSRRGHPLLIVLLLVIVVGAVVVGGGATYLFHAGPPGDKVTVTIPAGSSLTKVAQILADQKVVPNALAFIVRARLDGHGSQFKAGTYALQVNEPNERLTATLIAGAKARTVRITVPEGYTLAQTAALLRSKLPGFPAAKYLDLTQRHPVPVDVAGFKSGDALQGLLFPATYEVLPTVTPSQFIDLQTAAFKANLAKANMTRAAKANLTPYDVVIIASLIEREARASGDRAKIAAVIWNRLKIGMRLQIDATVLYALGTHKNALTYDDLKVASPYNTYLHYGLPPTPIDNPGLASLTAAADPVHADYLYYVGRSDGTGPLHFSHTYAQFLKDGQRAEQ